MSGADESSAPPPRRRVYGRSKGRPLRPTLATLVESRLPELRLALPPAGGRLDPAGLFDSAKRACWLEIGFGGGEHLAWQAAQHPDVGLIGAEVYLNGVATAVRALAGQGARNVRLHHGDARALLDCLPEASLERVFILFPDPWPKARHHKRRMVQDWSLRRIAALLVDGGELRLATDDEPYLAWMLRHAAARPELEWLARQADDWRLRPADWPPTRYEQKAIQQGRKPTFLRYRRLPRAAQPA